MRRWKHIAILALCAAPAGMMAQCPNDNTLWLTTTPTCPGTSTPTTCIFGGEYLLVNVVAGNTYTFSTCVGTTFDSQITLYNNAGGAALGYNDDGCGLQSTVTWTATYTGQLRVLVDQYPCTNNSICSTLTITCATGGASPCTAVNIPSLPVTGQAVACNGSNLITTANVLNLCGSASNLYLGGNEALYTVTPTTTGSYTFSYNGQTWSSIWVFTGACPAAGGTCVASISSAAASQSLIASLTAGVQYWVLFDTWPTPISPCPGSFSIALNNVPPPVVASDCNQAVNVCTNINFQIDPNGFGSVYEIPALGSLGNPDYLQGDFAMSPWGTDNWGCLRAGELNSTWMVVNVLTGGTLEFTFGGLGTQAGFYDWIMYPYSATACGQVAANTLAPVRCNWNGVSTGGTGLAATLPAGGNATNFEPPLNVATGSRWLICFSNWSSVTTAVPLVFGGTAVVSCSPLPVELLAFDATLNGLDVDLSWTTGTELHSSHFEVERSSDMLTWEKLAEIAAQGSSNSPVDYAHSDRPGTIGMLYYRLRLVDTDGTFEHSPIRSVRMGTAMTTCHPNPNEGTFFILDVSEGSIVQVFDQLGRLAPALTQLDAQGRLRIELLGGAPGMFAVRIDSGTASSVTSVLVTAR
ncbi:MAG: T9SS type A sorting domain-containing protein [Flavobacteriales bacterium]|nr:T9SS type A sorting domain-containing protein [Flavobacteriales bacterium]